MYEIQIKLWEIECLLVLARRVYKIHIGCITCCTRYCAHHFYDGCEITNSMWNELTCFVAFDISHRHLVRFTTQTNKKVQRDEEEEQKIMQIHISLDCVFVCVCVDVCVCLCLCYSCSVLCIPKPNRFPLMTALVPIKTVATASATNASKCVLYILASRTQSIR